MILIVILFLGVFLDALGLVLVAIILFRLNHNTMEAFKFGIHAHEEYIKHRHIQNDIITEPPGTQNEA